ncbi:MULTISPECIES: zinc ribbon domain-containing protein [Priestia]|uniref:zinc ribbon domain-containing protein n=1 Tax=Priestia TaxID=2800373 RepID=UPI001C8EDD81|nr:MULTISPECIES: zinc ribbon domain-containing protein [Priestia]MBX9987811.1 zinc ribbon domain-containing protein [Priestia aryabhattai]MDG0060818.1 zinc ribbon domain-containing protein [Priestia sp. P5]UYV54073.1 zinc ribbon domain-containing protein [Priestia megaterium]
MNCSNCGHFNDGGKFCVKCGHKLQEEAAVSQAAAASEYQPQSQPAYAPQQPNQRVQQAKKVSKSFFGYFVEGIKNPTATAQAAGEGQFINALITVILYALSIPIMLYVGWKLLLIQFVRSMFKLPVISAEMDPSDIEEFNMGVNFIKATDINSIIHFNFTDFVFKQGIFIFIGLAVIIGATYVAAKFGKVDVSFKEFFSRFGTFLIIPTALLLIGLVLAFLHVEFFSYFMNFGLLSIFLVVPFTIASFKPVGTNGLDRIYSTLIVYVVITIVSVFIANGLGEEAKAIITRMGESTELSDFF